jgi:hypothetical protein
VYSGQLESYMTSRRPVGVHWRGRGFWQGLLPASYCSSGSHIRLPATQQCTFLQPSGLRLMKHGESRKRKEICLVFTEMCCGIGTESLCLSLWLTAFSHGFFIFTESMKTSEDALCEMEFACLYHINPISHCPGHI